MIVYRMTLRHCTWPASGVVCQSSYYCSITTLTSKHLLRSVLHTRNFIHHKHGRNKWRLNANNKKTHNLSKQNNQVHAWRTEHNKLSELS